MASLRERTLRIRRHFLWGADHPAKKKPPEKEMKLSEKEAKLIRTFVRGQFCDYPDLRWCQAILSDILRMVECNTCYWWREVRNKYASWRTNHLYVGPLVPLEMLIW